MSLFESGIDTQKSIEILLKKLSVREVERIVRKIATDKMRKKKPEEYDAELIEIEKKFMETLGTRVEIQKTGFGGKLLIDYFSVEDLEEMLKKMHEVKFDASKEVAEETDLMKILGYHTPLQGPASEVSDPTILPEDDSVKSESDAFESMEVEEIYISAPKPSPNVSYLSPSYFHPNVVKTAVPEEVVRPVSASATPMNQDSVIATPQVETPANYVYVPEQSVPENREEIRTDVAPVVQNAIPVVAVPEAIHSVVESPVVVENPVFVSPMPQTAPLATTAPMPTTFEEPVMPSTPASLPVIPIFKAPVIPPVVSVPASSLVATPVVEKKDDDGDLYSIKNFSI